MEHISFRQSVQLLQLIKVNNSVADPGTRCTLTDLLGLFMIWACRFLVVCVCQSIVIKTHHKFTKNENTISNFTHMAKIMTSAKVV